MTITRNVSSRPMPFEIALNVSRIYYYLDGNFKFQSIRHCGSYGVKHHFQQNVSYIVAISFIGGENRRKPPTSRKTLRNLMLYP